MAISFNGIQGVKVVPKTKHQITLIITEKY
jgi:hypothetical protein